MKSRRLATWGLSAGLLLVACGSTPSVPAAYTPIPTPGITASFPAECEAWKALTTEERRANGIIKPWLKAVGAASTSDPAGTSSKSSAKAEASKSWTELMDIDLAVYGVVIPSSDFATGLRSAAADLHAADQAASTALADVSTGAGSAADAYSSLVDAKASMFDVRGVLTGYAQARTAGFCAG